MAQSRIGLVLGAGGAVGHAFHAGVLAALSDETGWDARDAEVVVGTSAGSLVGAFLRAGLAPTDLAARAGDATMSEQGRRLVERAEAATRHLPPIPARPPRRRGVPAMSAPGALMRAAMRPWKARPGALAAAALPAGRISTEVIASGLRPLFDHWPDRALDQRRRAAHQPARHLRPRPVSRRRRRLRGRGVVRDPVVLRARDHQRCSLCRRRRPLPDQRRPRRRARARPRGDQLTDVGRSQHGSARTRSARTAPVTLRPRAGSRANSSRRHPGHHVPTHPRRPRGDGSQRDGPFARGGCKPTGSGVGA